MDATVPITDIRSYALDDGPGIRTTVFFKGCPLACTWCHNPETIDPRPQVQFSAEQCIGCGDCVSACPARTIGNAEARVERNRCRACGICADQCPTGALEMTGTPYTVESLFNRLMADREFFMASDGGVTLSGGEATIHARIAGQLLRRLKENGIHTLLETCGHYNRDLFQKEMRPWLDMIYFDLKLIDPEKHRQYTGQDNRVILENLRNILTADSMHVTVRTPLVPGITDTTENLDGIKDFLSYCGYTGAHVLLPYNPGGDANNQTLAARLRPTGII